MEFETPIRIRVTPGADPKVFSDFERFSGWANQQLNAWEKFGRTWQIHELKYPMLSSISLILLTQETEWSMAADGRLRHARDYSIPEFKQFELEINEDLSNHSLLAIEQPLVERAFALASIDPEAAGMLLVVTSDKIVEILEQFKSEEKKLAYFARAIAYVSTVKAYDSALSDHLVAVEKIAAGILQNESDREKMIDKSVEYFADFDFKSKQSLEKFEELADAGLGSAEKRLNEIESEWMKLRETYDRMLKLSEPRKYWSEKLSQHEKIFKRWRKAFFIVAIASSVVLATSTGFFIVHGEQFTKSIGSHTWVLPAMLLGVPAFMALWLLRMCGRQWQDHLSRVEDARERVVMVETFLALSRDDASPDSIADPAQLAIVLGSIFRAGPGFSADDGPPAGLIDAIISRAGGKP